MDELTSNLIKKWGMSAERAYHREDELRKHFPKAWVEGYEPLIDVMNNHPKDRHVLAAAVRSNAGLIVTYNREDFPVGALEPWGIERQGPSTFLQGPYDLDPGLVVRKLHEQAANIDMDFDHLLARLKSNVPAFVQFLCDEQVIGQPGE